MVVLHCPSMRAHMKRFLALLLALYTPMVAQAGIIRDAEIEHTLRAYSTPIFQSANIEPETVRIFIVGNPEANAYVAGGLNMFINTGLIRTAENPGMLLGVIAHETGHIAGAHISQLREKSSRAMLGSLIGSALGAAAAIGGGGQAGAGIMAASQNMAQRKFMGDIRLNEQAADHAALTYLDENEISSTGMLEMFEALRNREVGGTKRDPFMSDHPLTTERISTMRNHLNESKIPAGQVPPGFAAMHARMLAKLTAFLEPYDVTLKRYPPSDQSVAAIYARSIADFRRSHFAEALNGINSLIKQYPKDAYFHDTKGQFLFENGKLVEAASAYAQANTLKPGSALIKTDYARALIAQDKPSALPQAIRLLEESKAIDDSHAMTWRQLAIAYGKQGKLGYSYAALAEEAALGGKSDEVFQHIARARTYDQGDATLQLQLDDLERDAKAQRERKKRGESIF